MNMGKSAKVVPSYPDGNEPIFAQKRDSKLLSYSFIAAIAIYVIYLSAEYLLRDDPNKIVSLTDWAKFPINLLATACLFYAARLSLSVSRKVFLAWMMMALGQLSFALGDGIWAYIETVQKQSPFPSPADIAYLLTYPLLMIGLLLLPSTIHSKRDRIKMTLDTSIIGITSALFFWPLIIEPTIDQNITADALTIALSLAYPILDLILLFFVAHSLFRKLNLSGNEALKLLVLGCSTWIVTDTIFLRQNLDGTYVAGGISDTGYIAVYLFMGLAAIAQVKAVKSGAFNSDHYYEERYDQNAWPSYLPYLCVVGASLMLIWSHDHEIALSFSALSASVGTIVGLVIVRQILVLNENAELYGGAQKEIMDRKRAEQEIIRLNEGLEKRVWLRTSELETANNELQNEIRERLEAERNVTRLAEELDKKVIERTSQLQNINKNLESEVHERTRAELEVKKLNEDLERIVSEQKKLITELENERNRRISAERDAIWKDISFSAAHKMGNPIFAIESNLDPLVKSPHFALTV